MYDAWKILAGIAMFGVLVTSPLWMNALSPEPPTIPELAAPPNGATQCVEDPEWMRTFHMELLDDWREAVVREGRRDYTSVLTGQAVDMSLSGTCMSCHSNKTDFCDRCHTYMDVDPYCWNCHVAPKEVR